MRGHVSKLPGVRERWGVEKELALKQPASSETVGLSMQRLVRQYIEARPGLEVLQKQTDEFIAKYEEDVAKRRAEMQQRAKREQAEEGWTMVLPKGTGERSAAAGDEPPEDMQGKAPTASTGIAVESVGVPQASERRTTGTAKRRKQEEAPNFYHFQSKDAKRSELFELRQRFEDDKKRIAKLRESRKFNPH